MGKIQDGFNYLIWKLLPSCKDVTALLSRSMDSALPIREKMIIKFHLWSCIACRRYFSQLAFMRKALELRNKEIENEKGTPELSHSAAERIKQAVRSTKAD